MKKILLTFDTEEFDLLRELGNPLEKKQEFEISKEGLLAVTDLLGEYGIKATFFTTADFAKKFPKIIRDMDKDSNEIACHGYSHSDSYSKDISRISLAKQEIEGITKKQIRGFRAPRFGIKNISGLHDFGFTYDSSLHPTFIPGRYMNLHKKRYVHKIGEITEIPLSVLPFIRLPIFWLAFKNLGIKYSEAFTCLNMNFSDYTMLLFHPWEFADLEDMPIPRFMKAKHGNELLNLLEKYLKFAKKRYEFSTVHNFLQNHINI